MTSTTKKSLFFTRTTILFAVLSTTCFLSACAPRNSLVMDPCCTTLICADANYTETCMQATKYLLEHCRSEIIGKDAFDPTRPVICATTVDLDDFNKTTNFGRLIGQSIKIALQTLEKNKIIEVDLREEQIPILQGSNAGEFLLTRNAQRVAKKFNAGAVLVSTYSVAFNKVYIAVELINADQNVIVGAHQFEIPMGPRTIAMLENKSFAPNAMQLISAPDSKSSSGGTMSPIWPYNQIAYEFPYYYTGYPYYTGPAFYSSNCCSNSYYSSGTN